MKVNSISYSFLERLKAQQEEEAKNAPVKEEENLVENTSVPNIEVTLNNIDPVPPTLPPDNPYFSFSFFLFPSMFVLTFIVPHRRKKTQTNKRKKIINKRIMEV